MLNYNIKNFVPEISIISIIIAVFIISTRNIEIACLIGLTAVMIFFGTLRKPKE